MRIWAVILAVAVAVIDGGGGEEEEGGGAVYHNQVGIQLSLDFCK